MALIVLLAAAAVAGLCTFRPLGTFAPLLSIPIVYLAYRAQRNYAEKAEQCARRIAELKLNHEQLAALYRATVESLATAIDAKDATTHEHVIRVQAISAMIAEALGIAGEELEGIRTAALLHDIGELGVPEHILLKPGKLSREERAKIQKHAAIGAKILDPVHFPWPVAAAVRSHHERYDGSGYPDGLRGEDIPLGARILAVADVYEALTSHRSYREAVPHEAAVDHIRKLAGRHFDPAVVAAFLSIADKLPAPEVPNEDEQETDPNGQRVDGQGASSGAEEDIARANYELMALFEIAQSLSSTLNLRECLALLASKIKNIVGASTCVIFLRSGDDPAALRAEVAIGVNATHFHGARAVETGRTCACAAKAESWKGAYVREDVVLTAGQSPWLELKSALVVPLTADERPLGTINLYHTLPDAFDEDDLRVLSIMSDQAGVAVMNAQIFERTRESAIRDPLTGLHNSRYLFTALEQELSRAQRHGHPLSVLGIDLDNFKLINDNFGHERGDTVLKDVAGVFKQQVRDYDLVIRYAGDEFIIVLPETDAAEAENTADRIARAVARYARTLPSSDLAPLGVSIGVATFPEDANDVKTLLAKADASMYHEKRRRKRAA